MADDTDSEIKRLEEQLRKLREANAARAANERAQIEAGKSDVARTSLSSLGTGDFKMDRSALDKVERDTRHSIEDSSGKPTHTKITNRDRIEAIFKQVGIDDGRRRNIYEKRTVERSQNGATIERKELVISVNPVGVRGLVLPMAVITEETMAKDGKFVGSHSLIVTYGKPIRATAKNTDGEQTEMTVTTRADSVQVNTKKTSDGRTANSERSYSKAELINRGKRVLEAKTEKGMSFNSDKPEISQAVAALKEQGRIYDNPSATLPEVAASARVPDTASVKVNHSKPQSPERV